MMVKASYVSDERSLNQSWALTSSERRSSQTLSKLDCSKDKPLGREVQLSQDEGPESDVEDTGLRGVSNKSK